MVWDLGFLRFMKTLTAMRNSHNDDYDTSR